VVGTITSVSAKTTEDISEMKEIARLPQEGFQPRRKIHTVGTKNMAVRIEPQEISK